MKTHRYLLILAGIGIVGCLWLRHRQPDSIDHEPTAIQAVRQQAVLQPAPESPALLESQPVSVEGTESQSPSVAEPADPQHQSIQSSPAGRSANPDQSIQALPETEQQSLWSAFHSARHAVTELTANEKAMPQNEDVKFFAFNPGQRLTTRFLDGAVRIESSRNDKWAGTLRFNSTASDQPTEPRFTTTADNRIEYQHPGGVTEWYVNQGEGIEHGFTVARRPAEAEQKGELRLEVALEGLLARPVESETADLADTVELVNPASGRAVLRYEHLQVWDAEQHALPARLEASGDQIAILVADAGATYPLTIDPLITSLEAKFEPEFDGEGADNDQFGSSVALSGDTALVGAYNDTTAAGPYAGSAYVFVRSGTNWTRQSRLIPDDVASHSIFGVSVALSGDTALVGAPAGDPQTNNVFGAAYVFVRTGGIWSQQEKLAASDGANGDYFGIVVGLAGNTAVVGAFLGNEGAGSAYIFVREGTNWSQQAKLVADDGTGGDLFGGSVAISGETALIGVAAPYGGGGANSAYVFVRNGTNWNQQTKLLPDEPTPVEGFGNSVALEGDTALVGAYAQTGLDQDPGSAYVFVRNGTTWTQQVKFTASNPGPYDHFGDSVALSGETALVGAAHNDNGAPFGLNEGGAAYVFVRNGTLWSQQAKLIPSAQRWINEFGRSVALDGDTALVGAPLDYTEAAAAGSAQVFVRNGTSWSEQTILTAGDPEAFSEFGHAVALEGNTALIGAWKDATPTGGRTGSAYVLVRTGSVWSVQARFRPDTTVFSPVWPGYEEFGTAVALSGDTVLIGAPQEHTLAGNYAGVAYVFVRVGGVWSQQAKLMAGDAFVGDQFGLSVAVSGNTAIVGAPEIDYAYVYTRSGTNWSQQAQLDAFNYKSYEAFGTSVSISGDTLMVGALYTETTNGWYAGSVYVFVQNGASWSPQAQLKAEGATGFGAAVAVQGNRAIVGAPWFEDEAKDKGAAYVFSRNGTNWSLEAKLESADSAPGDFFGSSVSLSGCAALVGVYDWITPDSPSTADVAFLFVRRGGEWFQEATLVAADADPTDHFANAVALSGDTLLVGASLDDSFNPDIGEWRVDHGSVYIFRVPYDLDASIDSLQPVGNSVFLHCTGGLGVSYDVQRSTNTVNWTTVHTTNTPSGGQFEFTDLNPPQPMAVYRLKRN